jgi:nucleoside-diphosphate-sugar epimerase
VARALLVGCGCRGRELGRTLREDGWEVRGTTRELERSAEIERAGIEPAVADPDLVATILDHVGDVTLVAWLLGSATGDDAQIAALHGPRLERVLEDLVDTPVRGFLYEGAGSAPANVLLAGEQITVRASERWRIPVTIIEHDPADWRGWLGAARTEIHALLGA